MEDFSIFYNMATPFSSLFSSEITAQRNYPTILNKTKISRSYIRFLKYVDQHQKKINRN